MQDCSKAYTAVSVETIDKNNFEKICEALADGVPLIGVFYHGAKLKDLKYGQIYKAPTLSKFKKHGRRPTAHAVVIIGAGRECSKEYLYFLNSWGKKFCPRYNESGELVKAGVGKLRFMDLIYNPILLNRTTERGM